jgi:serine/threonine protein kinase
MWSAGVVLFTAIVGYPPFSESYEDGMELNEQIQRGLSIAIAIPICLLAGRLVFLPIWKTISQTAQRLIRAMIRVDVRHRVSAVEALQSQWFDDPGLTDTLQRVYSRPATPDVRELKSGE